MKVGQSGRERRAEPLNYPAIGVVVWWSFFGAVSVYWAFGGTWLVDTAIQGEFLATAEELPLWLTALVLFTGIIKFGFALYGYLINRPDRLRLPRWLYASFGLTSGVVLIAYGLLSSLPLLPYLIAGDMTPYRWMRLLVWMPQFWMGGVLILLATLVYLHRRTQTGT